MKRYKLNIKRIACNIAIIVALMFVINMVSNYTAGTKHIETKTLIVSSNDTLWNIANKVCKESKLDLNVQNVIIEIKNINNMQDSTIFAGQEIAIPIYG